MAWRMAWQVQHTCDKDQDQTGLTTSDQQASSQ